MATLKKCPHDDQLTPASCTDCMDEGNIPPNRVTVNERPFRAKLPGSCYLCDRPIDPGDLIFGRSDGTYIHFRHAPTHRRAR